MVGNRAPGRVVGGAVLGASDVGVAAPLERVAELARGARADASSWDEARSALPAGVGCKLGTQCQQIVSSSKFLCLCTNFCVDGSVGDLVELSRLLLFDEPHAGVEQAGNGERTRTW